MNPYIYCTGIVEVIKHSKRTYAIFRSASQLLLLISDRRCGFAPKLRELRVGLLIDCCERASTVCVR
jgi:hypothetical protein